MEALENLITGQPAATALALILVLAFITEWIVPGKTHQRALDTIEEQRKTIEDLKATAKANTEASNLAVGFMQAFDERLRKEGERQ